MGIASVGCVIAGAAAADGAGGTAARAVNRTAYSRPTELFAEW